MPVKELASLRKPNCRESLASNLAQSAGYRVIAARRGLQDRTGETIGSRGSNFNVEAAPDQIDVPLGVDGLQVGGAPDDLAPARARALERSEEHTSELQSLRHLV